MNLFLAFPKKVNSTFIQSMIILSILYLFFLSSITKRSLSLKKCTNDYSGNPECLRMFAYWEYQAKNKPCI